MKNKIDLNYNQLDSKIDKNFFHFDRIKQEQDNFNNHINGVASSLSGRQCTYEAFPISFSQCSGSNNCGGRRMVNRQYYGGACSFYCCNW